MLHRFGLSAALSLVLPTIALQAQEWDGLRSARGWARFDATGAATFYDSSSRQLITWMKEGGILSRIDLAKAEMAPERWVSDDEYTWIMAGATMKQISKTGQVLHTVTLPAEAADADFIPPNGIAISYRTLTPFIERRDIKSGSVAWTFGKKPKKGESTPRILHRIFRNDETNLVIVSRDDMFATVLDSKKGTALGQAVFTYNDGAPPQVSLGERDRGSVVWWWGKNVAFSALPASSVAGLNQKGLVLARMDFSASTLEFIPTGVTEDFSLAGIIEDKAALVAPNGGMVFIQVK